jgi:CheY-like chemotaxis protein
MENSSGDYASMTKLRILWVDDDASRLQFKDAISGYKYVHLPTGKRVSGLATFLPVKNQDAIQSVLKEMKKMDYDLVIVDHFLRTASGTSKRGNSLATVIRESNPNCPIIGVTAADRRKEVDPQSQAAYDDLLSLAGVGDSFDSIFSTAIVFRELAKVATWSNNSIFSLFHAPDTEKHALLSICPKYHPPRSSFIRTLYNWTRTELIASPGFLYDRKWVATLLGINEGSFSKVEELFAAAKYTGIACTADQERWWKAKIKDILYKNVQTKEALLPWQAGRQLGKIKPSDYAKCKYCAKEYPETMGYTDQSEKQKLVPLHFRCANLYPTWNKRLYFDDKYLMKDHK